MSLLFCSFAILNPKLKKMKKTTHVLWMALAIMMLMVSCTKKSSEKQILSFRFDSFDEEAVIVEETKTISVALPFGADVTNLVPIIVVSEKAMVSPGSGVPMNYTEPVLYTVTAEDGSQALYTIIVTVKELTYQSFVGIWGVEKIDYYNIDYAGNPIVATMETYEYDPFDIDNGIQFVFREDKSGEMRDSTIDSLWVHDSYVYYPDTTLIYPYTYTFDENSTSLLMNMDYGIYTHTLKMFIKDMTINLFVYENEYATGYIEKAYLRRINETPSKSVGRQMLNHPHKRGSFLGDR